jgi:hypothetical protein
MLAMYRRDGRLDVSRPGVTLVEGGPTPLSQRHRDRRPGVKVVGVRP